MFVDKIAVSISILIIHVLEFFLTMRTVTCFDPNASRYITSIYFKGR